MPAFTFKVAVIGPSGHGKSQFCNFMTNRMVPDYANRDDYETWSTVGCRILQHDCELIGKSKDKKEKEEIEITLELWDISGEIVDKYKDCANVIKKDLLGVIILFDSSSKQAQETQQFQKHLLQFYQLFVHHQLSKQQCLLLNVSDKRNSQQHHKIFDGTILADIACLNLPKQDWQIQNEKDTNNNKSQSNSSKQMLTWIGELFGFHPDAEFGVF